MPSVWDLSNEDRPKFEEIRDAVKSRIGFFSGFHESELVKLFRAHGFAKTFFVVERCMANDWLKPDRYAVLMDVVEEFGIERTLEAIKALNKLENHSIAMVENICRNPSLAKRKAPGAQNEPPRKSDMATERMKYPTKDRIYLQANVRDWMLAHDKSLHDYQDYFTEAGREAIFGWPTYQLKKEYQ
jgi:hypothetical protein